MGVKQPSDPVGRALADIRRANARLVNLLGHEDERVWRGAAAALAALDPPPIAALADALIRSADNAVRLRIIAALGPIAAVEPVRVGMALTPAYMAIQDPDVRLAIVDAMMRIRPAVELAARAAGPGPAPPGGDPPLGGQSPR